MSSGAPIRGHTLGERGSAAVAFGCGVAEAEAIGSLVAIRWTSEHQGMLSTAGHDGQTPTEFPITRQPVGAKVPEQSHKTLVDADAQLFFETVTADWELVQPFAERLFPGTVIGFRRGLPVMAIYPEANKRSAIGNIGDWIKRWIDELATSRGGDAYADAAWIWDRLQAPLISVGGRTETMDISDFASHARYVGVWPSIESYKVSSATRIVQFQQELLGDLLNGQLQDFLQIRGIQPEGYINRAYVLALAEIRCVTDPTTVLMAALGSAGFRLNFKRTDTRVQYCRGDEAIDLWLAYSCPERGLLVTLEAGANSPLRSKLERWPGTIGPTGRGILTDAPKAGRISRWLTDTAATGAFVSGLDGTR